MNALLVWAILITMNIPVFIAYGKLMYGARKDFLQALRVSIRPGFHSLVDGTWFDDLMVELKLSFFILSCAALLAAEYTFIVAPFFISTLR
jgi:hypothetical protein